MKNWVNKENFKEICAVAQVSLFTSCVTKALTMEPLAPVVLLH